MEKLTLTKTQQELLTIITLQKTSPQRLVLRAGIILDYAQSGSKQATANASSTGRQTIYRWITRWQESDAELELLETEYGAHRLSGPAYRRALAAVFDDAPRPGHPTTFTEEQKQRIIALAADEPEKAGIPITHWTCNTLRDAVIDKGIVPTISRSHVWHFLKYSHTPTSSQ